MPLCKVRIAFFNPIELVLVELCLHFSLFALNSCLKSLFCNKSLRFFLSFAPCSFMKSFILPPLFISFFDILDWGWLSFRLDRYRAVRILLLMPINAESTAKVNLDLARGAGTYRFGHLSYN